MDDLLPPLPTQGLCDLVEDTFLIAPPADFSDSQLIEPPSFDNDLEWYSKFLKE